MIKKIDHVVITTADITQCITFYEALGFSSKSSGDRYELYAGDFKINVHIKGNELSPHAQNVATGSADLCFEISDDIADFKTALVAKGLVIELGIVDRTGVRGGMRSIYLRDPDGNLVEFCRYD